MKYKSIVIPILFIVSTVFLSSFLEEPLKEKFIVDSKESALVWKGKKVTGEHTGNVQVASGTLTSEGKSVIGGNFEIDLTTITVTDITDPNSNAKLVGHLKSDDFFSVTKFPKAIFVASSIENKSGNEYFINGKLTIKGITNDVKFPAITIREGKRITTTAKIVIDRTKFDIRFKSSSFFENLGDKAIYDDFELDVKLAANVQSGS